MKELEVSQPGVLSKMLQKEMTMPTSDFARKDITVIKQMTEMAEK
jgi:hypothetical protein